MKTMVVVAMGLAGSVEWARRAVSAEQQSQLGIWAWDSWPIYNGSNTDCNLWDWSALKGRSTPAPTVSLPLPSTRVGWSCVW